MESSKVKPLFSLKVNLSISKVKLQFSKVKVYRKRFRGIASLISCKNPPEFVFSVGFSYPNLFTALKNVMDKRFCHGVFAIQTCIDLV